MQLLRRDTGRILVFAHRTASEVAPPNSWSGLLAAADARADVIEMDVQVSADGVPVLYHQYRLPGGGFLAHAAAPMLDALDMGDGRPPPRLDEVLDWLRGQPDLALMLDVKNGFGQGVTPFMRVLESVRRADAVERVILGGWDHMGLLWAKRHLPGLTTCAFLRGVPLDLVALATRCEAGALSLDYDLCDTADIDALHEAGVAVILSNLFEPNFRYPIQLGVDGVQWGDPAALRFALERQTERQKAKG